MPEIGQRSCRVDSATTGGNANLDAADSRPVSEVSERRAVLSDMLKREDDCEASAVTTAVMR